MMSDYRLPPPPLPSFVWGCLGVVLVLVFSLAVSTLEPHPIL